MSVGLPGAVDTGIKVTTTVSCAISVLQSVAPFNTTIGRANGMEVQDVTFGSGGGP